VQDLLGPWQATPFAMDPALRIAVEDACRRDVQEPRAGRGIVDARGRGVATVRLTGPVVAKCDALIITPEGEVEGAGGGTGGFKDPAAPQDGVHIGFIEGGLIMGGGSPPPVGR
jgi:hypothetical protein